MKWRRHGISACSAKIRSVNAEPLGENIWWRKGGIERLMTGVREEAILKP
jgi:hypothetical protein